MRVRLLRVAVIDLNVLCSYPMREDAIAASDCCGMPAVLAVEDRENHNLYDRCRAHQGQVKFGVYGRTYYTVPNQEGK